MRSCGVRYVTVPVGATACPLLSVCGDVRCSMAVEMSMEMPPLYKYAKRSGKYTPIPNLPAAQSISLSFDVCRRDLRPARAGREPGPLSAVR